MDSYHIESNNSSAVLSNGERSEGEADRWEEEAKSFFRKEKVQRKGEDH